MHGQKPVNRAGSNLTASFLPMDNALYNSYQKTVYRERTEVLNNE